MIIELRPPMRVLEDEISKYKKKGFEVVQKRTLKYGTRVYLKRKKGGLSGLLGTYEGVYIYFVDGDATVNSMREFLKDYDKFYRDEKFTRGDMSYLVSTGAIDNKTFRDLRNALIKKERIRDSIKALPYGKKMIVRKERATLEEERIKEKVTEREITRRRVTVERVSVEKVLEVINAIPFVPQPKEKGYEAQLYTAFHSQGLPVEYESQRRGARFDLVLGDIAVELKVVKSAGVFDPLYGQVARYRDQFNKVIIVLIDQFRNPSIMNKEIERLKKIAQGNIEVVVK